MSAIVSAMYGLIFWALRMQFTVRFNADPNVWRKYKNTGSDLVVLGVGAIMGAVSRVLTDAAKYPAEKAVYLPLSLSAATAYWMFMYGIAHPTRDEAVLVRRLGRKLGKITSQHPPTDSEDEKEWVSINSWRVRFFVHSAMGLLAYAVELWLALVWAK